jgi:hypothetical protein
MRAWIPAILLAIAATPAAAQISGNSNSLNATNDRLSRQSEIRGIRNQQQFENNQIRSQIQRNELFRPAPTGPIIAPPRR